jgi:hypothetical protein
MFVPTFVGAKCQLFITMALTLVTSGKNPRSRSPVVSSPPADIVWDLWNSKMHTKSPSRRTARCCSDSVIDWEAYLRGQRGGWEGAAKQGKVEVHGVLRFRLLPIGNSKSTGKFVREVAACRYT